MADPFLSLIIPAYNEERRLPQTLEKTLHFLQGQEYPWEVIVVDNHSTDRTAEIIAAYQKTIPSLRGIYEARRGKGNAVQTGMLAAEGTYRFMADADLSMPISEVNRFLPPRLENFDVAIASREALGAIRYDEPHYRHLGGRLINTLIRLLVLPDLHDTQCGFKCFRAPVAEDLFGHQTLGGWSFDIEILAIARLRGYRIVELPIPWYFNEESKVNALRDAFLMTLDLFQIRRNIRKGVYEQDN